MTNSDTTFDPKAPHDPERELANMIDTAFRAAISQMTSGLSPAALMQHYTEWALHMASSPGKQLQLGHLAFENWSDFSRYLTRCAMNGNGAACAEPDARDRRFRHEGWAHQPFAAYQQAFLLTQKWWDEATTGVRGMSRANERVVNFAARQILDAMAPSNFIATNPEILEKTIKTGGANLLEGARNFQEDVQHALLREKEPLSEEYCVGERVAVTPGKVVYRNHLIELIQYEPATEKVQPEPVLIVPAWIMKYYILDLSPENSMVKYLTEQGFTVFMISWRNPGAEDAGYGMADYRRMGPMAALDEVTQRTGATRVHAVGYCLGGTLLSIAAAAMAREGDTRLASLTLLAAQMDFTEAGELTLFINESEVSFLEDMMWRNGYLDAAQMAGAFQLLRSNDLIWSRLQHEYLMGETLRSSDLMAWNADSTRMPYRMHSEYLRQLFLENAFATGKFEVEGHPVTPRDIQMPIFAVGTETDHVAPWKSAYKTGALTRSEVTFALTNGGHNAGVLSEPGHHHRHFRLGRILSNNHFIPAEEWAEQAETHDGSWWLAWVNWLKGQQRGEPVAPPKMGNAICDAPGTYVMMR
ncbi:MAG: alpha/beta fold hydrolase [Antarcticimicrobium sp.]|uniref:PHA/PHB synthase family protein n=1 Tax=Antarcticimicrobium sp. TaxID=2824147 RepID=UPI002603D89F|nr:alpha/beta fold hydrolase [Antarcticimicrobium sp.]MDF1716672.1 alpha/beta fold hydrolase [Antarcticimicrobium sp.]